jgi:hypothetical protein
MRALKSILRWFLALQAIGLIFIPVAGLIGSLSPTSHLAHTHARTPASAILSYAVIALLFAFGALFAMAWWTTRKPRATPSAWALAASTLDIVQGALLVWLSADLAPAAHIKFSPSAGLWLSAFGLAGLFVFSRREAVPDPAVAARKGIPIAGDRTSLATRYAVTGLSLLAQIAALFFWTRWALTQHLLSRHGLSWIVLVAIASIATTLVHECGHAVLAWCFEMGLLNFRAGPLHAVKREGKWKFKFHAAGLISPGGSVGAIPTRPDPPRWEEIVMIAAGPSANLLIGAAAIWAVLHDRWASYPQTWELIAYTGAFCLIAATLNLIPFLSEDGGYSDGARILQIITRSPIDDFHRAIASVASTAITPRRYRDLDIAQIERAAILFPNDFRGLHLLLCACQFYEESGQLPEASAALDAAQTIYEENAIDLPGPLHTVFVIGHAWLNRDAIAARLWWDRMEAKKHDRPDVDYLLAKAALFWIEGHPQQSEEAWQKANSDAETLPSFGAFEFDRLLCTLLHEAFHQPSLAAVTVPAPFAPAVPAPAPSPVVAVTSVPPPIIVALPSTSIPEADPAPVPTRFTAATSVPAPIAVELPPTPIPEAASVSIPTRFIAATSDPAPIVAEFPAIPIPEAASVSIPTRFIAATTDPAPIIAEFPAIPIPEEAPAPVPTRFTAATSAPAPVAAALPPTSIPEAAPVSIPTLFIAATSDPAPIAAEFPAIPIPEDAPAPVPTRFIAATPDPAWIAAELPPAPIPEKAPVSIPTRFIAATSDPAWIVAEFPAIPISEDAPAPVPTRFIAATPDPAWIAIELQPAPIPEEAPASIPTLLIAPTSAPAPVAAEFLATPMLEEAPAPVPTRVIAATPDPAWIAAELPPAPIPEKAPASIPTLLIAATSAPAPITAEFLATPMLEEAPAVPAPIVAEFFAIPIPEEAPAPVPTRFIAATPVPAPIVAEFFAIPIPEAAPAPVPTRFTAATPGPAPIAAVPTLIPEANPALASVGLVAAVYGPAPTRSITPGPAPVATAFAPSAIAPIAIAESAPAQVEAIIPIPVAASEQSSDHMEVLSTRLSVLTKPVSQPAPIAPLVTTVIDPVAGSMTRIPVAALQSTPARITLIPDSPGPAALAPPKPNAPAVPAAFARRARPAPLPPGAAPDPFLVFQALARETPAVETPVFETPHASETTVAAVPVASPPAAFPAIIPDAPTVTPTVAPVQPTIARVHIAAFHTKLEVTDESATSPEKPTRYDPLDFIRAAAIKDINASVN